MDSISLRKFSQLKYQDPQPFLARLRTFEIELSATTTPERIRNLRTNQLKNVRELREAAIFCFLMGQRLGTTVGLAPGEDDDYDFVAAWSADNRSHFTPVQLKELPPESTAPNARLNNIISKLQDLTSSTDLVVAIHLNREVEFSPAQLTIPSLSIAELWAFGATTPDQNTWTLWGDLLRSPTISHHTYPST